VPHNNNDNTIARKTATTDNSKFLCTPGLKEAVAESFDKLLSPKYNDVLENELI
jgi:hypothetical protein